MALIEKRGTIRLVARLNWNLSSYGSQNTIQSNGSPGLVRGANGAGFAWRGAGSPRVLFNTSGRETGTSVIANYPPEIRFFIGDTQCVAVPEPTPAEPFNVGHHLAGDNTGGSDPTVAYPGQVSPDVSRLRMDAWAKNALRGATLANINPDAAYQTPYSYCEFEGMRIAHHPDFNNHSPMLNAIVTSMSNSFREGQAMFARLVPAELASGGYRNFVLSLAGTLPEPVVRDIPVIFFRQDSSNVWNWYIEEDKVSAWPLAVQAMQEHIRMLQRIFQHVTAGGVASAHPEWNASSVRPIATVSPWLTAEQLTTCDEWWQQVVDLRTGLAAAPTRASVINGAKASEDPVAALTDAGFTQDGSSPAELYQEWLSSGSNLPYLDWLAGREADATASGNGTSFLDALTGGAKWVGDNVVDIVKDWGATGTLGFLAGAKVIASDELPPWAIPVGIAAVAFLLLK